MNNNIIPIFPLNLVMFPEALYPLHIFEGRYKRMINRCLHTNEYFGIVSKIEFDIAKVGCLVKIERIINSYENGNLDIIVRGYSRFLAESTNLHPDGYLEAQILIFGDHEYDVTLIDPLFHETVRIFKSIIRKTSLSLGDRFWQNLEEAEEKSFKLAEKSGLNLRQQQDILSLQSESERLSYLRNHLSKLENSISRSDLYKELILSDGYLNEG